MKTFFREPFMSAYRISLVAGLLFFALILFSPKFAIAPLLVWITVQTVMIWEFASMKRLDPRSHLDERSR